MDERVNQPEEDIEGQCTVKIYNADQKLLFEGSMADLSHYEYLESVRRLTQDLAKAAKTLSKLEVRYLVDAYYALQRRRIAAGNQLRALSKTGEPHTVLSWFAAQGETLESQVKRALDRWTDGQELGRWVKSVTGIGPVIAAGLLAHIDIEKCPTVGHIWSFAGLSPHIEWEKGCKRPYNARLKILLAYKLGESFVKVQNNEHDVYGKLFVERRLYEQERNEAGGNAEQARAKLAKFKISEDAKAKDWYAGRIDPQVVTWWRTHGHELSGVPTIADLMAGDEKVPAEKKEAYAELRKFLDGKEIKGVPMLPPAHIHARARRYAVKQFLADFHGEAYRLQYGKEPPLPYPIQKLPGHTHLRAPRSLEKTVVHA